MDVAYFTLEKKNIQLMYELKNSFTFLHITCSEVGVTRRRTLGLGSGVQTDELESDVLAFTSSSSDICRPSRLSICSSMLLSLLQTAVSCFSMLAWKYCNVSITALSGGFTVEWWGVEVANGSGDSGTKLGIVSPGHQ